MVFAVQVNLSMGAPRDPATTRLTPAQTLRESKDKIFHLWRERARQNPAAAFMGSLSSFLDQLADSLQMRSSKLVALRDIAWTKAEQADYTLLRQILFEVLEQDVPLSAHERNIILDLIDEKRSASVDEGMRQVREQLSVAEERLSFVRDSARMGTFDWDVPSGKLIWSDTLKKIWGYGPDEFIEKVDSIWARIHPEDRDRVQAAMQNALMGNRDEYDVEYRVIWPDGSVRWISVKGRPHLDAQKKTVRISGTTVDITEWKKAEEVLRQAQANIEKERAWYEMVFDKVPTAIALVSGDRASLLHSNEAMKRINIELPKSMPVEARAGYQALDRKGRRIPPSELPRFRVIRGEEVRNFEMRWQTPNGTIPLLINGTLLPARYGRPPTGLLTFQEISELKRAQEALQKSEHHLRLMRDSIPQIVWTATADGKVDYHNENLFTYTGLVSEPRQDFAWQSVVHPDDLTRNLELWDKARKEGKIYVIEHRLRRHDGVYRWFLTRGVPLRDSSGAIVRWFGSSTDIDDQKKTQQALEQERELREQFVSTLTHDLRNPLIAAKMSAQLIAMNPEQIERIPSLAARVIVSIDRADKMIEQLLDANRIRAGKGLSLEIVECNLAEIAEQVCEDLTRVHGDRLVRKSPPNVVGFWSCSHLRRILENLLTNAIKYGYPHTPVTLQIQDHEKFVEISVLNQGEPIPPGEQEGLFELFHRSTKAEASAKRGWGLGLSLVKGVSEAHGGRVEVRSSVDEGTVFTVVLPKDARVKKRSA